MAQVLNKSGNKKEKGKKEAKTQIQVIHKIIKLFYVINWRNQQIHNLTS